MPYATYSILSGNGKSKSQFMKDGFAGVLQRSGGDSSEWQQDCLACLLKLLCQLGVSSEDGDVLHDVSDSLRNKRARRFRKGSSDKLVIPKLNEVSEESFTYNKKKILKYMWSFYHVPERGSCHGVSCSLRAAMLSGMRQGLSCMFEVNVSHKKNSCVFIRCAV